MRVEVEHKRVEIEPDLEERKKRVLAVVNDLDEPLSLEEVSKRAGLFRVEARWILVLLAKEGKIGLKKIGRALVVWRKKKLKQS